MRQLTILNYKKESVEALKAALKNIDVDAKVKRKIIKNYKMELMGMNITYENIYLIISLCAFFYQENLRLLRIDLAKDIVVGLNEPYENNDKINLLHLIRLFLKKNNWEKEFFETLNNMTEDEYKKIQEKTVFY